MTPLKEWFTTYKVWNGGLVYMENENACKIVGIGYVIHLSSKMGQQHFLGMCGMFHSLKET